MADWSREPLPLLYRWWREFGDVVAVRIPPKWMYVLFHPEHIRQVFDENRGNYWRGEITHRFARRGGKGLAFSLGDLWSKQRRLLIPAFQRRHHARMVDEMSRCAQGSVERWRSRTEAEPLDMGREMCRLTLEILGRSCFGVDLSAVSIRYAHTLDGLFDHFHYLASHTVPPPLVFPTRENQRFRAIRRELDELIDLILATRRASSRDADDLLAVLLGARDDTSLPQFGERQLRDELTTFLSAGYETTAMALTWFWYLMGSHPEVHARVREEVRGVLGGRAPGLQDIPRLEYTRRCIDETLRLYPVFWTLARQAYEPDEIGGYTIPAGGACLLSPFMTHRHPEFWKEPESFDPDRFLPEHSANRPRYAYMPFGGGERRCIGESFALLEATVIVAVIVQACELSLVDAGAIMPAPAFTLRQSAPVRMWLG